MIESKKTPLTWIPIVFHLLHAGEISESERKNLNKYFNWKVGQILRGITFKPDLPLPADPQQRFIEIRDTLRSSMTEWLLDNKQELENLSQDELWNRFDNRTRYHLENEYSKKASRHGTRKVKSDDVLRRDDKGKIKISSPMCDTSQEPIPQSGNLGVEDEENEEDLSPNDKELETVSWPAAAGEICAEKATVQSEVLESFKKRGVTTKTKLNKLPAYAKEMMADIVEKKAIATEARQCVMSSEGAELSREMKESVRKKMKQIRRR